MSVRYDDGLVECDDDGLTIRRYFPWGDRRLLFREIRGARTFELPHIRGKWRLWGSGDLVPWYHLDLHRPRKRVGIELGLGSRVRPCITPDDVDTVMRAITEHLNG